MQQKIIKKIVSVTKPKSINTSIKLYQLFLEKRLDIQSELLPLCSNIKRRESSDIQEQLFYEKWKFRKNEYCVFANFGSYYHENWDIKESITELKKIAGSKKILLVAIGKISDEAAELWKCCDKVEGVEILTTGILSDKEINMWFGKYIDYGLVTTPMCIIGKSGSYMVFREFHIPVIARKDNFGFRLPLPEEFWRAADFAYQEIDNLVLIEEKMPYQWDIEKMGAMFCKNLVQKQQ
ncbi:MAG: hypothetical protein QM642_02565 [Edaphocola sp.]